MSLHPRVLVVVPVYDEAALIQSKLANLAALDYPQDLLRVLVVDGGSSDGTPDVVARLSDGAAVRIVRTRAHDKTAQINTALRERRPDEWVLVTDADARLPPDTVDRLLRAGADADVGVVGTPVRPTSAHVLERLHWRVSNRLRQWEARFGSAGLVTGPCYLVRADLAAELPADAVADDVHFAYRAMARGLRVAIVDADVRELRSPRTLAALVRHKYRKGCAWLREVIRFLPSVPAMAPAGRAIFLVSAALLLLVLAGVSAAALVMLPFSRQTAGFGKILQPAEYGLLGERE